MLEDLMVGGEANLWLMLISGGAAPTFTDSAGVNVSDVLTHGTNAQVVSDGYTANGIRLSVGGTETAHTLALAAASDGSPVVHLEDNRSGITWSSVGTTTPDDVRGALLYWAITGATPSYSVDIPLVLYDCNATFKTTNGGDLTFNWGTEDSNNVVCKYKTA
jgi:hypothetical protein